MVNVTYDACKQPPSFFASSVVNRISFVAGDMIVTEESGTVSVYNAGDIAWILTCTALVWLMIPGLGFFYSGLLRRKNALSQMYLGLMVLAVVAFQVRTSRFVSHYTLANKNLVVLLGLLSNV